LEILDVSVPASIHQLSGYDTAGTSSDVLVSGDMAYVADGFNGLYIFNVRNPAALGTVKAFSIGIPAYSLAMHSNYLFAAAGPAGLHAFRIWDGPPAINSMPANLLVGVGTNVAFSPSVSGSTDLQYSWLFQGVPISGATNKDLMLMSVLTNNSGVYELVATHEGGAATGTVATLTVMIPPSWLTLPESKQAVVGDTVSFAASATGSSPLSLFWYNQSTNGASPSLLPTTNAGTLVLTNIQRADAGWYFAVASNAVGVITGAPAASLTVFPVRLMTPFRSETGRFQIALQGELGCRVQVQVSDDLKIWAPLENRTNQVGTIQVEDPTAAMSHRFYRVVEAP
jgi:hypothetical protein